MTRHRRRAVGWLALAVVLAIVAIHRTGGSASPPLFTTRTQVVVTVRPVAAGHRLTRGDLGTRRMPSQAVDGHRLTEIAAVAGRLAAVDLPAGSPVMDAELLAPGPVPRARDVAIRLDDLAGVPSGAIAGAHADLYLTTPGRPPRTRRVLRGVEVVAASRLDGQSAATLRLPEAEVATAIQAEGAGQLRLVVDVGAVP
ncbi:MAG TPA: SAF domain-containing protein [Gaiellales bacterium]|nr:SAF domain-containing protein [Gaiellales bacterium]